MRCEGTLLWAKVDDEWPWWPAEVVGCGPDFEEGPSVKVKFYETNKNHPVYKHELAPWEEYDNIVALEETRMGRCPTDLVRGEMAEEVAQGAKKA